jgi:hypothetical protein
MNISLFFLAWYPQVSNLMYHSDVPTGQAVPEEPQQNRLIKHSAVSQCLYKAVFIQTGLDCFYMLSHTNFMNEPTTQI